MPVSMSSQAVVLRGGGDECAQLDRLREGALAGRGGVLVLRGEAGVGKTALLDYVIATAPAVRAIRVAGIESEMELAFAALHQLCAPILDRLDRVPGPQRGALETTFGLSAGTVPDRLLVGLAVLSLLSEVAQEQPLFCVIDDAQWLDRSSAEAWRSWRGGCTRTPSYCCSRRASRATRSRVCRSYSSRGWGTRMRAHSCPQWFRVGSTSSSLAR